MIAKVCGLIRAEDIAQALAVGADLLGFLDHPASVRHCPDPALADLAGDRAVRVRVADSAEHLLERLPSVARGWVQPYLPAAERGPALAELRRRGFRVLLPWPDQPEPEPLPAELYLWESSPALTGVLGGSGQGHGGHWPPPGPFLLAGGLSGPVLAQRLAGLGSAGPACRGFDAASGLDQPAAPGRTGILGKDPGRVEAFVLTAHALHAPLRSSL